MANNVYESRREVYVEPFAGTIKYGFLTNVASAVGTSCGHTAVDRAQLPAGLVFGANRPKPGRASKRRTNGVDSTFYDYQRYAALRADGWSLSNPRIRRGSVGAASRSVYISMGGIKYAWKMPQTTYTRIAERAQLGIDDATSNDNDLVWGARGVAYQGNIIKPPRAFKVEVGQDGVDTLSTFVDPSRVDSLPAGWSSSG